MGNSKLTENEAAVSESTPGPWHWRVGENGQGYDGVITLVGSPDNWEECDSYCFGWKDGSEASRGPLKQPGHEHNTAPEILGGDGWHGSGNLTIDIDSPDAALIARAPGLVEENARLRAALEAVEWGHKAYQAPYCLLCKAPQSRQEGHYNYCIVGQALSQ